MSTYFNPVKIIYTENWFHELKSSQNNLDMSNPIIITSPGNRKRLHLDSEFNPVSIFSDIGQNPNFVDCDNVLKFC